MTTEAQTEFIDYCIAIWPMVAEDCAHNWPAKNLTTEQLERVISGTKSEEYHQLAKSMLYWLRISGPNATLQESPDRLYGFEHNGRTYYASRKRIEKWLAGTSEDQRREPFR